MKNIANDLIKHYISFIELTLEYNLINNKLKKFTRENENSVLINGYSLQLKIVDKSHYTDEIIPYLRKNKFNKFIEMKINENKINNYIKSDILTENYVLSNIEKEKTVLDIDIQHFDHHQQQFEILKEKEIGALKLKECIIQRENLKHQINDIRYIYYKYAKQIKDILYTNNSLQHQFNYQNLNIILKYKVLNKIYSHKFIEEQLKLNPDIFYYSPNSKSLLLSKNKKIDKEYINQFKIEKYQEYLYIAKINN